jgi:hypothetical protein
MDCSWLAFVAGGGAIGRGNPRNIITMSIGSSNRLKEVARCTGIALETAGAGKLMEECRFTETLDQLLTIAKAHHWEIES